MGPYPLLDCQNSLKKRRPPRGRVARVMDRAHTHPHTHLPVWPLRLSCSRAIWRVRKGRSKNSQVTEWVRTLNQSHNVGDNEHCCNEQRASVLCILAVLWSNFVAFETFEGGEDELVWGKCFLERLFQIARRAI